MPTELKIHVFRRSDHWETLDTYWTSPLSFWAQKSLRIEPPLPLRVTVLGAVVSQSEQGWINYGGMSAMFVQAVQAKGEAGQRVRAEIHDEAVTEHDVD
ncbi:MAG: hypothetical protein K0V04_22145 [Deltaproteobacteria bacterium]|nr:hypothetical protein [Deltaproteobacteria bacterium]